MRKLLVMALAFAGTIHAAETPLQLNGLFSDGMVVQRNVPIPVWGLAQPGSTVSVHFGKVVKTATADDTGHWKVVLEAQPASSEPSVLEVSSQAETRTVKDVLVGEVWLCSGQSNMAMRLLRAKAGPAEIAAANDTKLRAFSVPERPAQRACANVTGQWLPFTKDNAGDFSAFSYFFAKRLRQELKVPVGLIFAAWPGSSAVTWISPEALRAPEIHTFMPEQVLGWPPHHQPSNCYNGMIFPLAPFPLAGVLWYQGETDGMTPTQNPYLYRALLAALITDWRSLWHDPSLPFYWVQLPNLRGGKDWPVLRESQADVLRLPHTGMIPTLDIGTSTLLHPKNKDAFGDRMASLVLARQYGGAAWDYPHLKEVKKDGKTITVAFDGAEGLKTTDGAAPQAFEIAGADGVYQPAEAAISGATVQLHAASVPQPESVRYAWQADPKVNLVNAAGAPAAPFRTDQLPVKGQEFVWQKLPAKSPLATIASGAALAEKTNLQWTMTSSETKTSELLKAMGSGALNIIFKDDPSRRSDIRFASPTLYWTTGDAKNLQASKGATAEIDMQLVRATNPLRGFDFEMDMKQGDGTLRRYLLTIFPMEVQAWQGGEVRKIGYNLDNAGDSHRYRIAVRADGIAQVYFDDQPLGVLAGDVVPGEKSFIRIGKTVSDGFLILHLGNVAFDTGGAYAPVAGAAAPSRKSHTNEDDNE